MSVVAAVVAAVYPPRDSRGTDVSEPSPPSSVARAVSVAPMTAKTHGAACRISPLC